MDVAVDEETFREVFTAITAERPTGGRPRDATPEDAVTILNRQPPEVRAEIIGEALRTGAAEMAEATAASTDGAAYAAALSVAHSHIDAERERRTDERQRVEHQRTADEQLFERVKRACGQGHYGEAERIMLRMEEPSITAEWLTAHRNRVVEALDVLVGLAGAAAPATVPDDWT
jgi:glycosyltransferase A (GT-A) superfamily protein (DUF2064 family)